MTIRAALLGLALVAAGCGGRGASSTASPAATLGASPVPASPAVPTASAAPATVPPIHVVTSSSGGRDTTITQQVRGRLVYDVRAISVEAQTGGAGGNAVLERPHVRFHDRAGKITIADAPQATVSERDKSVLMTGGVRARTQEGVTLSSDTLRYDTATEKLQGEGNVVLTDTANGITMSGDHLAGDVRLHAVRVWRGKP